MNLNVVEVVVLEATERAEVETYQDGHYLGVRQARFPVPVLLPVGLEGHFFHIGIKFLAKIVRNTENFYNFVS